MLTLSSCCWTVVLRTIPTVILVHATAEYGRVDIVKVILDNGAVYVHTMEIAANVMWLKS